MEKEISEKVKQYESFLNDSLKEDLKFLETKLREINEKLSNWYIIMKSANDLRDYHANGFKTYVDVGCGIMCQANVPDPSVININIGLNVYLTMTLDEADQYCNWKITICKKEIEHIQMQANQVKAHIKLVLLGLQEIQNV
ncbi:Uxt prefoldin-like subunit [Carabus blaptoides fortunei]